MTDYIDIIKDFIKKSISNNNTKASDKNDLKNINNERIIFETLVDHIENYTNKPVHTIQEIKDKDLNKKIKGDLWAVSSCLKTVRAEPCM